MSLIYLLTYFILFYFLSTKLSLASIVYPQNQVVVFIQNFQFSVETYFLYAYFLIQHIISQCRLQKQQQIQMIESIINLLRISYSGPTNQDIKLATQHLLSYIPQQGFLPTLMQISIDSEIDASTTCAALSLIKNNVRSYWSIQRNNNDISLDPIDKQYLINNILTLNIALSDNYKYGKIIKDIISLIGKHFTKDLLFQVLTLLERGEELRTCLNFLLGIANYYRYQYLDDQILVDFIKIAIPQLTETIMKGQEFINQIREKIQINNNEINKFQLNKQNALFNEILYLSIKFMFRTLKYIDNLELRQLSITWAKVCLNQLKIYNEGFMIEILEKEDLNHKKGSQIFNYFHGRKWAIRYLDRFIQSILIYKKQNQIITNSTKLFYQQNWNSIAHVLQTIFSHPSTYKLRCFQVKLLQTAFRLKPKHMFQWADHYQFEVLPNFIKYQEHDYSLARQNPIEFLADEQAYIDEDNLKMISSKLWLSIAFQITKGINSTKNQPRIDKSLQFIKACITHNDNNIQLTGMYLICKLLKTTREIQLWNSLLQKLIQLCNLTITTLIKSNDFLIIVKLLSCYKEIKKYLNNQNHQTFCNFIIIMLVQEHQDNQKNSLIKIMAIISLGYFQTNTLQTLNQQQLKYCLNQYLSLIHNHQLQEIMISFKCFLLTTHSKLYPYALQIIKMFHQKLTQFIQTQINEQQIQSKDILFKKINKDGIATQTIQSLTILCNFINQNQFQIKQSLQNQLLYLLQKYFQSHHYLDSQIIQLFNTIIDFYIYYVEQLLNNKHTLSKKLHFYYTVIVLKVAGLSIQQIKNIQNLELNLEEKNILTLCVQRQQYSFPDYFRIIRLYLKVIDVQNTLKPMKEIVNNILQTNQLEQLFFLVYSFYQKGNQDTFYSESGPNGQILSMMLLVQLIQQHFQKIPSPVFHYMFVILKKNNRIINRKLILRYHMQFFSIWIWAYSRYYISTKNLTYRQQVDSQIVSYLSKLNQITQELLYQEYKRFILGLSFLLKISLSNQKISNYFDVIVDYLFIFMRKKLVYQDIIIEFNEKTMGFDKTQNKNLKTQDKTTQQRQQQQIDQDYEQPNLIISLQPKNISDKFENFDNQDLQFQDIKFLFEPGSLYSENYQTQLDTIDQNTQFFKSLQYVHLYYPEVYYTYIFTNKNQNLKEIIDSLQQQYNQQILLLYNMNSSQSK